MRAARPVICAQPNPQIGAPQPNDFVETGNSMPMRIGSVSSAIPAIQESTRRPVAVRCGVVAAILLAGVLMFHQQLLYPRELLVGRQNDGQNDLTAQFVGWHLFAATAWRQFGEFACWNLNLLSGAPTVGNPQSAVFYPPNMLSIFWDAPVLASWMMVLHHWLAGGGGCHAEFVRSDPRPH